MSSLVALPHCVPTDTTTRRVPLCPCATLHRVLLSALHSIAPHALPPNLVAEDLDPVADAKALAALGDWMIRLSPLVAIDGTDGLILETTGCDHLYGGEHAMMEMLSSLLATVLLQSNPKTC